MDEIVVGIIIALAVIFTIKRFIRMVKGKTKCNCSSGCACSSNTIGIDKCEQRNGNA